MKRLLCGLAAVVVLTAVAVYSRPDSPSPDHLIVKVEHHNPWTNLRVNHDASDFRFALVSDRNGGARHGVFERAVEHLNLLQPEFVVSVGDLIAGYTNDHEKIAEEWKKFDAIVHKLKMPFFYVPGNHDLSNKTMGEKWQGHLGRKHYHFLYKDVLFLALDTEDPPENAHHAGHFSHGQIESVHEVLEHNRHVRWTFVFMHRPVWAHPAADVEKSGWLKIEKALEHRPYTVFAGHEHRYRRFERHGRKYYILATTGGASKLRGIPHGEFDHLVWITMKKDGPVLANISIDGVFREDIKTIPASDPALRHEL
jgi:hypothetical protein